MRRAVSLAAPLLAVSALALYITWERSLSAGWAASVGLATLFPAVLVSAWGILIPPSRALRVVAVGALLVAILTAVLWWLAISRLVESS